MRKCRLRPPCAVLLVAALASCATPLVTVPSGPDTLPPGQVPASGEPAPDRDAIRTSLFAIGDRALGNLADASSPLLDDRTLDADVRIRVLRTQLRIATSILDLVTTRRVEIGVLDLYAYLSLCATRMRGHAADATGPESEAFVRLGAALADPLAMARTLLEQTATREQVSAVEGSLAAFLERDHGTEPGLLFRLEDFAEVREMSRRLGAAGGMFAEVSAANEEIRSTRETGELLSYALQRLPLFARWNARLLLEEATDGPGATAVRRQVEDLSQAVGTLSGPLAAVAAKVESLDARLAETTALLADPEGTAKATLGEIRSTLEEARGLLATLGEAGPEFRGTLAAARETIDAARDLRRELAGGETALAPEEMRSLVRDLAGAAADLKAALADTRAVLADDAASKRLEDLVTASRTATDYLFWRAGLLLVVAACLGVVVRIAFVLTARRGADR